MAKYTVKFSCGHEGVVDLIGKEKDRQRRIEYLEGCGLCTECYKAKIREKEAETPLTLAIQCNPLDTLPFRLVFSGNTLPVKDEIKKLGYSWGRIGTGGILNVLSKPTPAWYTDARTLEELEEELKKATEVFPDFIIHRNFSQSDLIVYTEKQKKEETKKAKIKEKIAEIPVPQKPACYPEGYWNQRFYTSRQEGKRRLYIDGKETTIPEEDAQAIENYLQELSAYKAKIKEAKKSVTE